MPMQPIFIYALIDPESGVIRYVGRTNNLRLRMKGHRQHARGSTKRHLYSWMRSLKQWPEMRLLETCDETNWADREKFWIAKHKQTLTNHSDGGYGPLNTNNGFAKSVTCVETGEVFESIQAAADSHQATWSTIKGCIRHGHSAFDKHYHFTANKPRIAKKPHRPVICESSGVIHVSIAAAAEYHGLAKAWLGHRVRNGLPVKGHMFSFIR